MDEGKLVKTAYELIRAIGRFSEEHLPDKIADIVKTHAMGAAASAVGLAWIPGVGDEMATAATVSIIWSMYFRINKELGLTLSETIIKGVAAGVATNLAGYVAGTAAATALSFIPVVGTMASMAIESTICYALIMGSGFVYLKVLTNVFKAGHDPVSLGKDDLHSIVKEVIENEDVKSMVKEAHARYKKAKEQGATQSRK